ncbi:MAG: 2-oxoacid:acceptor oxidoreductase subunit alpha [Lewinellaceae bacterium]|nr:2-oxoacid:acceptor oxidoreductase subunit alpha [Lewinellaceae bacterium]MCB9290024.1 2-oxoacid:acceptor oxidoreductase subunit alpha [Lewinellaceae bacterium]
MNKTTEIQEEVTIKFAGDSGDGMQLTGTLFTDNTALSGSDLATFPDFPAEIRAPQGTLAGVSGFQLHFGSREILTPGDEYDVLVAMNAAALKSNLGRMNPGSTIIVNTDGFDKKNLRLAKYEDGHNPLEDGSLDGFEVLEMQVTKLTRESLIDAPLSTKEKDLCKNMFVLGFLYWRYNRQMDSTIEFLSAKFGRKPEILEANITALKAGYHYGETTEEFTTRYNVKAAPLEKGTYRNVMGNEALVIGLITAAQKAGIPLFYGSYPITPASDVLHGLARYKHFGVRTFQAEDEIAAICAAIGAAYGGNLAVTGTSGPGMALKTEAMGLALMLELPLVICDIQRGGPSTGLPTKTEQSDLLQALYGRNGESPMPVLSASSPADCFEAALEASRIALQHMTPVILLSDGYIANGAEPWKFPKAKDIPEIEVAFKKAPENGEPFLPYGRDERYVREWAVPGTKGLAHRIGGLEKQAGTGEVSYDPANHEYMVKIREAKVEKIADFIPEQKLSAGPEKGRALFLGWGSTYGVIKSVVQDMLEEGYMVAHAHLRHLRPFPRNLKALLDNYETIIIPEINNGQLSKVIREKFLREVVPYNKIQGVPITKAELSDFAKQVLEG